MSLLLEKSKITLITLEHLTTGYLTNSFIDKNDYIFCPIVGDRVNNINLICIRIGSMTVKHQQTIESAKEGLVEY